MNGVDKAKIEPLIDKYKFTDKIESSVIESDTYEEFKNILLQIADDAGIIVPEDIAVPKLNK